MASDERLMRRDKTPRMNVIKDADVVVGDAGKPVSEGIESLNKTIREEKRILRKEGQKTNLAEEIRRL